MTAKASHSAPKAPKTAPIAAKTEQKAPISAEIPQEVAETPAKAAKTVKIKVLRSHPKLGYSEGDQGEISQALYDQLIGDGPFFEKI